jgi:23S rRNA (uridine2552-2'-O)-methyltransferase
MAYNRKDFFFHKAKKENFAARSVFKLEEIDQKFRFIKAGMTILDLGCAPGSWAQYTVAKVGPKGFVLGIDLQAVKLSFANARFVQGDIRDADFDSLLAECGRSAPVDGVLSDMAPRTSGIRESDQARSLELCEMALAVAERYLRPGGAFVCKLFNSGEFEEFRAKLRAKFERVEVARPKSTRKESMEIFLIGLGRKRAGSP